MCREGRVEWARSASEREERWLVPGELCLEPRLDGIGLFLVRSYDLALTVLCTTMGREGLLSLRTRTASNIFLASSVSAIVLARFSAAHAFTSVSRF